MCGLYVLPRANSKQLQKIWTVPLECFVASQLVATPFCTRPEDVFHLTSTAVMWIEVGCIYDITDTETLTMPSHWKFQKCPTSFHTLRIQQSLPLLPQEFLIFDCPFGIPCLIPNKNIIYALAMKWFGQWSLLLMFLAHQWASSLFLNVYRICQQA